MAAMFHEPRPNGVPLLLLVMLLLLLLLLRLLPLQPLPLALLLLLQRRRLLLLILLLLLLRLLALRQLLPLLDVSGSGLRVYNKRLAVSERCMGRRAVLSNEASWGIWALWSNTSRAGH